MRTSSRVLVPVFSLLTVLGCSDGGSDGNVKVVLSATSQSAAAPSLSGSDDDSGGTNGGDALSRLSEANVTFASMFARNLKGELISLGLDLPQTVDLKALLSNKQLTLPAGTLPAGDYDQLVVVMTQVELKFVNGGGLSLTPPGGGWTSIVRVTPFTIADGAESTIDLKFHLGGAFRGMGNDLQFFPDFEGHHHDD